MAKANTVSVDITAQIAGFKSALAEASKSTQEFASSVKGHIESLTAPFAKFNSMLIGIAAVAGGGAVFKDIISETVNAATETNKLAMSFGMGLNAASELSVELKTLGISNDDYTQAAMKLDRQIRTNGEGLQRHGMVIRDSNGQLLGQQALMQNAISWLGSFKEGTDRNIAAQVLFGKGIGDVNALMKLSSEAAARAKKDTADLGLAISAQDVANAKAYKIAIAELSLTFDGIKKAIGDALLPYLTKFADWFREKGPTIIAGMKDMARWLINSAIDIAVAVSSLGESFENFTNRSLGAFHAGMATTAAATGNFVRAVIEAKKAYDLLHAPRSTSGASAVSVLEGLRSRLLSPDDGGDQPIGVSGSRSANGLGKNDDKKADQIAKLRAARVKEANDAELTAEDVKNKELLDLGQLTQLQFLQLHLDYLQRKAAADEDGLTKERDVFARGTVEWEKAENARLKASQNANALIMAGHHQIVMEQQRDYQQLATSINSALVSGFSNAFQNITKGIDGLKQAFTGFLKSLQQAFSQFAAQSVVKGLFGASSGAGGLGGLLAGLLPGHAVGGTVMPGQWAIAGEQGPELIYGGQGGASVTPNSAMGGGGVVNHNYNIDARGATGNTEIMAAISRGMDVAYQRAKSAGPGTLASFQNRFA